MRPVLCIIGVHRPFTTVTELFVVRPRNASYTYNQCDRCGFIWYSGP